MRQCVVLKLATENIISLQISCIRLVVSHVGYYPLTVAEAAGANYSSGLLVFVSGVNSSAV